MEEGKLMDLDWTFGDRLRKIRRVFGLSQSEFADAIGMGHGSIANWESGLSKCRDEVAVAKAIEREFEVPAAWTLGLDGPEGRGVTVRYLLDSSAPANEDRNVMASGTVDHPCDKVVDLPENLLETLKLGDPQNVREEPLSALVGLWCAARNYSPASARQRSVLVGKFIRSAGDPKVRDLDAEMVLAWWADQQHLAPETLKSSRAAVKGFIDFLVALDLTPSNPVEVIAVPRIPRSVPKVLTREDVERLRASLRDDIDRITVEAMLGAGLRCVEVSRLRAEDFRDDGLFVVNGKGSHRDLLPVPQRLGELVEGRTGRLVPLSPHSVTNRMSKVLADAGLGEHSAHSLRRTFATELLRLNDISVVQAALRHSSLETTQRYVAASEARSWRLPA